MEPSSTAKSASDCNEPSVDEGAFWHTNMDLYYGYVPGEVVEVEHESNKYWLASIQYCFKHLALLKWVGNYGSEFWVDTSPQAISSSSSTTSSSGAPSEPFGNPKRLYSLGHHLQAQMKSQFILEKPTRILEKPSLYNPSKDPYANIKTVDDLLVHDEEQNNVDTFASINKLTSDTASLALAKCKNKINYGQEDQDELEAALQSLTGMDECEPSSDLLPEPRQVASPKNDIQKPSLSKRTDDQRGSGQSIGSIAHNTKENHLVATKTFKTDEQQVKELNQEEQDVSHPSADQGVRTLRCDNISGQPSCEAHLEPTIKYDETCLELCKRIQSDAMTNGKYHGLDSSGTKLGAQVFLTKPKLLYDVGGANHERLFMKGTLLSVTHTFENPQTGRLEMFQWPAFVVKNTGGRLTLRWFLCSEPKFKQGRLELRSSTYAGLVHETPEQQTLDGDTSEHQDEDANGSDGSSSTSESAPSDKIPARSLLFTMHFCNPRIRTIPNSMDSALFEFPQVIKKHLIEHYGDQAAVNLLEGRQLDQVFDARRINLDRDRPLINDFLMTVRSQTPSCLDIGVLKSSKGFPDVLMSCSKMTKLLNAKVKRTLEAGVYEVHSEPLNDSGEIIKFIYPFDSSYTILPIEWSYENLDCLSAHASRDASRNPSPSLLHGPGNHNEIEHDDKMMEDTSDEGRPVESSDLAKQDRTSGTPIDSPSPRIEAGNKAVPHANIGMNLRLKEEVESHFKVMDQLEIVHPSSDSIICSGRIRKVVYPLLWIQLSSDCYTLVPFDLTDIYPVGWCEANEHRLVSLLPPRRRCTVDQQSKASARASETVKRPRKKVKIARDPEEAAEPSEMNRVFETESFDLVNLKDRQAGIDYILHEKSAYIKIFFNHKCFTGPSLSKSKICTLPQYVGPGPMRLVIEEVVTKLISVAYVPPRILNDLSSKSFEELLVERNLTNTIPMEFKAKYQKRVHRDTIPICLNPEEVALYCECICEHIKCCYNLFGLNLYDGDFCPSNCRSLTKSNKFMKRATYYREKARQGEISNQQQQGNNQNSESNKKDPNSRDGKKNCGDNSKTELFTSNNNTSKNHTTTNSTAPATSTEPPTETSTPEIATAVSTTRAPYNGRGSSDSTNSSNITRSDEESEIDGVFKVNEWTIEDVAHHMDKYSLGIFKTYIQTEGIDGQALMLLDRAAIEEHFQLKGKPEISREEVNKLCVAVDWFKEQLGIF